ncbi:MAG: hypothetical protein ACOC7R_05370, partial [Planctomycetota bacterium]
DLWRTAVTKVALVAGAVAAAATVAALGRRLGAGPAAAVAAAVLALGLLETAGAVALAALLRTAERRAHRWALRAVGDAELFADAMRKLHGLSAAAGRTDVPASALADHPSLADVLALAGADGDDKRPLS